MDNRFGRIPTDDYTTLGGTSAAAPHVAAIAGLLKHLNPSLTATDIRNILRDSADKVGGVNYDSNGFSQQMGYGRLNAAAALYETMTNYSVSPITSNITFTNDTFIDGLNFVNASNVTLTVAANTTVVIDDAIINQTSGSAKFEVYGKLILSEGSNLIKVNMDVENGGEFIVQPGSKLFLSGDSGEPWANIYIRPGAKFVSYGTKDDPVNFLPYSGASNKWHRILLQSSSGNLIRWTLFDGAEEPVYIRSQNNLIENSTFRNGWRGISTHLNSDGSGRSFVSLNNVLIENNETVGIVAYNGDMDISNTSIKGNGQAGLYMYHSNIYSFHHNLIENNGVIQSSRDGIEILSTGWLNMQNGENGTVAPGYNKIKDNADDQISTSGYLVAGTILNNIGGYNTISGEVTSNSKLIDNNSSSNSVMSYLNYWGGTPTTFDFDGSITNCCNYSEYLFYDPANNSGSGNNVPMKTIKGGTENASFEEMLSQQLEIVNYSENIIELKKALHNIYSISRANSRINKNLNLEISDFLSNISENGFIQISSSKSKELRNFAKLQFVKHLIAEEDYKAARNISNSVDKRLLNRSETIDYYSNLIAIFVYNNKHEKAWKTLNELYNFEILNGESLKSIETIYSVLEENLASEIMLKGESVDKMTLVDAEDLNSLSAYPNPFNPATVISFTLPYQSNVRLVVYDILGREVAELINSDLSLGVHKIQFDASNISSGVYFYSLNVDGKMTTNKFTLIK